MRGADSLASMVAFLTCSTGWGDRHTSSRSRFTGKLVMAGYGTIYTASAALLNTQLQLGESRCSLHPNRFNGFITFTPAGDASQ